MCLVDCKLKDEEEEESKKKCGVARGSLVPFIRADAESRGSRGGGWTWSGRSSADKKQFDR